MIIRYGEMISVVIIGYGDRQSVVMIGVLIEDNCCDDRVMVTR